MTKKYRPDIKCPVTNPTAKEVWWMGFDAAIEAKRRLDKQDDKLDHSLDALYNHTVANEIKRQRMFNRWYHPATKVIEEGAFCDNCGSHFSYEWHPVCGGRQLTIHYCGHKEHRGISY